VQAIGDGGRKLAARIPIDVVEARQEPFALTSSGGDGVRGLMNGSVGFPYRTRSGVRAILTNAHVTSSVNAEHLGRSVTSTWPTTGFEVGRAYRVNRVRTGPQHLNRIDAALARLTVSAALLRVGRAPESHRVAGTAGIDPRVRAGYFYLSKGVRKDCENPNLVQGPVTIRYGRRKLARFGDFVELEVVGHQVRRGDSGSALLRAGSGGVRICGLVFAGVGARVFVARISDVLDTLGRQLIGQPPEDVRVDWT
jgi:hypothetical protein